MRRSTRRAICGTCVTAEETAEAAAVTVAAAALAATRAGAVEAEEEETDEEGSGEMDEESEEAAAEEAEAEEAAEAEAGGRGTRDGEWVAAGPSRAHAQLEAPGAGEGNQRRPFGEAIAQLRLIQRLTSPSAKVYRVRVRGRSRGRGRGRPN